MQIKLLPGTNIHATVRNTLNFLTTLRETTACTHEPQLTYLYYHLFYYFYNYFTILSTTIYLYVSLSTHTHTQSSSHCFSLQTLPTSLRFILLNFLNAFHKSFRFALYQTTHFLSLSLYILLMYLPVCHAQTYSIVPKLRQRPKQKLDT